MYRHVLPSGYKEHTFKQWTRVLIGKWQAQYLQIRAAGITKVKVLVEIYKLQIYFSDLRE